MNFPESAGLVKQQQLIAIHGRNACHAARRVTT
jgi:hypothetical protein